MDFVAVDVLEEEADILVDGRVFPLQEPNEHTYLIHKNLIYMPTIMSLN